MEFDDVIDRRHRVRSHQDHPAENARIQKILHLPERVRPIGILPIGYPAQGRPQALERIPPEQIVHRDRWSGGPAAGPRMDRR